MWSGPTARIASARSESGCWHRPARARRTPRHRLSHADRFVLTSPQVVAGRFCGVRRTPSRRVTGAGSRCRMQRCIVWTERASAQSIGGVCDEARGGSASSGPTVARRMLGVNNDPDVGGSRGPLRTKRRGPHDRSVAFRARHHLPRPGDCGGDHRAAGPSVTARSSPSNPAVASSGRALLGNGRAHRLWLSGHDRRCHRRQQWRWHGGPPRYPAGSRRDPLVVVPGTPI